LKIVAYVKRAMSAASTISMACPDLYLASDGVIGAAVAYRQLPGGMPQAIEEKYLSAIRAAERSAANLGKRSELWMRAMSDIDSELSIVQECEGPKIVEGTVEGGTVIKPKGQILTATSREAVEWGLATGTAANIDGLKEQLGLKVWHNASKRPGQMMADSSRIARQQAQERLEADRRRQIRWAAIKALTPEMSELRNRMEKARARAAAAEQSLSTLRQMLKTEMDAIESSYEQATGGDSTKGSRTLAANQRQRALVALRDRYQPQLVAAEEKRNEALLELAQITDRMKMVTAAIPTE
jgi:hypothetical protein